MSAVPSIPLRVSPETLTTRATHVRAQDRWFDAAAALLLTGGVALFALGRKALTAMANGSYPAPLGETWVARADYHAAQTQWGIWLTVAGVAVALVSAARHVAHRRTAAR